VNIVCIIHSLDGGGAERVMAGLASRLAERKHTVTLITLDDGAVERHQVNKQVVRHRLDLMIESRNLAAKFFNTRNRVNAIRAAIQKHAPDVVLSFCDRTNILVLMAARTLDTPVVISERSDPAQQHLGTIWEYLRTHAYRSAASMIALTDASAAHLGERFGREVSVIPSAVEAPPIQSDRQAAGRNCRILGIGRLENEKGFDRLINAFATLAPANPDWSLRILGEGSARASLEGQIRELGLSARVSLPGWVRPVWDELAAATIFALPSRYEGFPSALLEAMACGVPSVAVDCPSGPRAVINRAVINRAVINRAVINRAVIDVDESCDDPCGLLVPNDTAALSTGILRLINDATLREQIGVAGKRVVDRFDWKTMVDAYEQVLASAADKTGVKKGSDT